MKTRVISGIIGVILLVAAVLSPQEVLGIGVFILALLGLHEFYAAVSKAGYKPVRIIGYISCIPLLLIGIVPAAGANGGFISLLSSGYYFAFAIFIVLVILFSTIIFLHNRYNIIDISLTVFGILYIVFLFSFITLTRNLDGGRFIIWLIFIGAWVTDTFAYFTGMAAGKTKLFPAISPKKTLEGSIGGIIGCTLITIIYGMFINKYLSYIPLYHYILIGVLSGIISQIGDWFASAIKRYVKIKDYGIIMPGHGGVLDRFDSILFVAPVIYFYISFLISGN